MYKLIYNKPKNHTIVIDCQSLDLAIYVLNSERLRTGQHIDILPYVLPRIGFKSLTKLTTQYYNFGLHGSRVTMYEINK